jgi:hypothetical protein
MAYYRVSPAPGPAGTTAWTPYAIANPYQQSYPYTQPYPSPATRHPENKSQPKIATPPPKLYKHWDGALKAFLLKLGLKQTLNGLSLDILTLNAEWEESRVPAALDELAENIQVRLYLGPNPISSEILARI